MITQTEIDFARSGPPAASGEDMERVIGFLDSMERGAGSEDRAGWITAHELLVALGFAGSENRKRWLRRIAEESDGQIISGQLGYKLTRHATAEETAHAAAWLEHQAVRLGERAMAIRKQAWSGERGASKAPSP